MQLSRHPLRPYALDYISRMCSEFVELHGDRAFRDDEAIIGGLARLRAWDNGSVLIIAHQKAAAPRTQCDATSACPARGLSQGPPADGAWRSLSPADHRTHRHPGAFPGIDAEERAAEAIAKNLEVMAGLPVPIVAAVIGEGGSGGRWPSVSAIAC